MLLPALSQRSPRGSFWRNMRFDQPELVVDAARYCGEQIGRVGVANGLRLADRLTGRLPKRRKRGGDCEDMLVFIGDAQRIGDEEGALARDLDGTFRHAAEASGALGDRSE